MPIPMDPWRTAIAHADETGIWLRDAGERQLLDAVLVGVSDHGAGAPSCAAARLAASGNRQSFSAAIAAGILAIGDEHGGAGERCMVLIREGVAEARRDGVGLEDAAM